MSSDPIASPSPVAKPTITSKEDFDAFLKAAKGPVVVDFMMNGCGACDDSQPDFEKLQADCKGTPASIARIDVNAEWAAPLADKLNVGGTPTALFAESAEAFSAGEVEEVDPSSKKVRTRLKCSR